MDDKPFERLPNPLPQRLLGEDVIHDQGGAFGHPSCPAAGAEGMAFAAKGHEAFIMASAIAYPQKALFQTLAFEVVFELQLDVLWPFRALLGPLQHKSRILLLYPLEEPCWPNYSFCAQ
jgi:hypothetical protein